MAKVAIKNLTKRFGKTDAVKQLNLEIDDGSLLVLLGPSGCGKTTTLRCVAGLEIPDEGEIYIGDRLINEVLPKDRDAAMVFQSYALYPHMTVFDNLAFPLKMRKVSKEEIKKKVEETAKLIGIHHLLDRKPRQLSGGEAQRTALGRAIVRSPQVFLMDEPLSNLDAKLRMYMRGELKRLQKELGITTIYVTHDQIEAMTMADKIAIMNKGELKQFDSPYEIYHHPRNMFVASFIGSPPMNLINCSLVEKENSTYFDAGSFVLLVPSEIKKLVKEKMTSQELVMGIRPEDISIDRKRGDIVAEVYVTEPLGGEVLIHLKVGDATMTARKPSSNEVANLKLGEKVFLKLNMDIVFVFDKKTEEALV